MLDPLYWAVSAVMWCWYQLFGALLGPASGAAWAMSLVFLVLTLRTVLIHPFLAQVRSGRAMRALAPELAELRRRHTGDAVLLGQKTRDLHREQGVSAFSAIVPALLQLPVFVGLLHVLRSFNRAGLTVEQNGEIANYAFGRDDVASFLAARLFGAPLSAFVTMPQWMLDSFDSPVDRIDVALVAIPLTLLAAAATHFSARHSLSRQPAAGAIMRWTPWIFPLGVLIGGAALPFPIAILLYWFTQNIWTLVQQHLVGPAPITAAAAEDHRCVSSVSAVRTDRSPVSVGIGPTAVPPDSLDLA